MSDLVNELEKSIIRAQGLDDAVKAADSEARNSGLPGLNGGPGDAYRHILISAEMTRRKGLTQASANAQGHEIVNSITGSQTPADLAMDNTNNPIGSEIGKKAKTWDDVVRMTREKIAESAKAGGDGKDGRALWNIKQPPGWKPNLANVPVTPIAKGGEKHRHPGFSGDKKDGRDPIEGHMGGLPGEGSEAPKPDVPSDPGQDDADGADPSKSGGDGAAPSGGGENQSARAAGTEPEDFTPEQRELMDDITKSDGPLDDILAKDPGDLTEAEVREVALARMDLPLGPEQEALGQFEKAFFDAKFGTGPVEFDAVGRMVEPEPVKPINRKPVPARTADGEPLTAGLKRVARAVAVAAGHEGRAGAVQDLQSGLNILKQVLGRDTAGPRPGAIPFQGQDLMTDGEPGPKTRRAVRLATARLGAPKVAEGLALGGFSRFAREVQAGRADGRDLGPRMETAFGPLFRRSERPERPRLVQLPAPGREGEPEAPGGRRRRPAHEAFALQDTINDLGSNLPGGDGFRPIREDGDIGEVTRTAFIAVLSAAGPDRFTSRLGHNLGFFDFDDLA